MNREDIIRMAVTARLCRSVMLAHFKNWDALCDDEQDELDRLMSFATLVAAAAKEEERAALATEAEKNGNSILAMQIRARGQA